jgi:hypothetical protein
MLRLQATFSHGLAFGALALTWAADTGTGRFRMGPIKANCEVSGLDFDTFTARVDGAVTALIAAWYKDHLRNGGDRDPVQEGLREEARLEMERVVGSGVNVV